MRNLEPQQIQLFRRHFGRGTPISGIALDVGIPRRSAYTLKNRVLRHLRRALEAEGLRWEDAKAALGNIQLKLRDLAPRNSEENDHRSESRSSSA